MTHVARPGRLQAHPPPATAPTLRRLADSRPRLVLVFFCLLCWLPGWFTIPATDRDEARFAQASKQMLETGDLVSIRNGEEARNRKPIGIYWLQLPGAALARAVGLARDNPIWPYRLPSLLGSLLAVLTTRALALSLLADRRRALLAGALLGGSVLLIVETHLAKTDAALLAATTLCMAGLWRTYAGERLGTGRAATFWLAMGAGILIKGPITPMVVALAAASLVVADRRARWLGGLRPVWGILLTAGIVLPWFVAIGLATHGAFFRDAVGGDLASKLGGGAESHGAPPGTFVLVSLLTLLPSGWLALRALPRAWAERRRPAIRFLLAWIVPNWIVFELVPTKLPHYVLPAFPALCILVALTFARLPRPRWLLPVGMPAVSVLALTALPYVSPLWTSARAARAVEQARPTALAAVGYAEPSLMFEAGTATRMFDDGTAAAAWLRAAPGRAALVEWRHWDRLALALAPVTPIILGEVGGLDYSNGHRVRLRLVGLAPWRSRGDAQ